MNTLNLLKTQSLGRYKTKKLIGKGAFGEVYLAHDRELRRNVAIKMFLMPDEEENQTEINDLYKEAQLLAKVEHANIVPLYDVLRVDNSVLMVMRYISGTNLQGLMKNNQTPMQILEAYSIFRRILLGIDYSHSRGVIHLDLKPSNILLSMSDEVFVSDFGISQTHDDAKSGRDIRFGTPLFMSPEQISGLFMDQRSDIYSLGMLFYNMITGNHPFSYCQSMEELIDCHHEAMPIKPSYYQEDIPVEIDDIIFKAIAKESTDRYRNIWSFLEALDVSLGINFSFISKNKDYRSYIRIDTSLPVKCFRVGEENTLQAEMIDLSVGGASLLFTQKLSLGGEIELSFSIENFNEKTSIRVSAHVVRQENFNREWTRLAVKFIDMQAAHKQCVAIYIRNKLLDEGSDDNDHENSTSIHVQEEKTLLL